MDTQHSDRAISQWFAQAQQGPAQASREWTDRGVALLPCGTRFCAVRLPGRLVHAACGTDLTESVRGTLARTLAGPVICDAFATHYYVLVEPTPRRAWQHQDVAPLLGAGTYLGVPATHLTAPPGTYWLVLPEQPGDLCDLPSVTALIDRGRHCLAAGELEETAAAQAVYWDCVAHLDTCPACRAQQTCRAGTRLRLALREARAPTHEQGTR
ncbi:hypothetical protein [Streptomyces sp. NPDC050395]|uniref:hypothetical protein n=1 Tax=Streptomyces sp. NPDC050395 TaxID=3155401 RepID=UPI00342E8057